MRVKLSIVLFLLMTSLAGLAVTGCAKNPAKDPYTADELVAMDAGTRESLKQAIIASVRENASLARNYRDLATIHQVEGNKLAAIRNLRDFVRNSVDDYGRAQAYYEIAVLIDLMKMVDDYRDLYIGCLENAWIYGSGGPQGDIFLIELGKGYGNLGRSDDAIKCFKLATERIQEKSRKVEAMMELAETYVERGDIQPAIQTFREVISLLPEPDTKQLAERRISELLTE